MADIEDPNLANDLLKNPPKTTSNLVREIKKSLRIFKSFFVALLIL